MSKIMNIYHILLSLLVGHYLLIKPEISLILGFFLVFLLIKNKNIKELFISLIIVLLSFLSVLLLKSNVLTNYGIVITSEENYFIFYNGISKFYVNYTNNPYEVFDIIYLNGEVSDYSFTNYESQFDFNNYLNNQLIFKQINVSSVNQMLKFPIRVNSLFEWYIDKFKEEGKTVISKLIFNKNYNTTYNDFINDNFLFYLLSISSLHVYLLSSFFRRILETKLSSKKVDYIIIILVIFLYFLSGYKISLLRILILNLINYFNQKKKLELKYLERVVISIIVIIIIDPSYPFSASFIYNISIPYYLVLISNAVSTFKKKYQDIIRSILIYLWLTLISIILNKSFSILTIVLIPIFTLIIMIILILGLLSLLFPVENLVNILSKGLLIVFEPITNIQLKIYMESNILFIFICIILIIFLILSFENKRKYYQRLISISLVINLITFNLPITNYFERNVYFINVGQGDSTLITDRGTNILVDTGGIKYNNLATKTLIPFFKKKNIYHLDYVFLTHQDYDHVGAFESLYLNFDIKDYNKNNNFTTIKVGQVTFLNLNPSSTNQNNDDSLVLYFELGNRRFLLMGDVSSEVERTIISNYSEIDIDVLKVSHHGSSSSTSEELLKAVTPEVAIISCGKNNYYNHPSDEVISRLEKYEIEIRRTDIEGTIKL